MMLSGDISQEKTLPQKSIYCGEIAKPDNTSTFCKILPPKVFMSMFGENTIARLA
jgi:hypothetical protein